MTFDDAIKVLKKNATVEQCAALDALAQEIKRLASRIKKLEQLTVGAAPKSS